MIITIAPGTEAKLRETATREGQDMDELADALLAEGLEARALAFAASVAAIQEGLDAVAQGRTRPLESYIVEQRKKRGLPESWPSSAASSEAE